MAATASFRVAFSSGMTLFATPSADKIRVKDQQISSNLGDLTYTLAAGATSFKINRVGFIAKSLAASTPFPLDLLTMKTIGDETGFSHVRFVYVTNDSNFDLLVGGGSTPFAPWFSATSNVETVSAGSGIASPGLFLKANLNAAAGWTVAGGSNLIKFDPQANIVPIRIWVLGD